MFLNADSLTNKLAELKVITDDYQPHIIGINEVLPKNFSRKIYPEEFSLDGYEMLAHQSVTDNTGRGTIMYVHKSITYKQIEVKIGNKEFHEAILIEVNLANADKLLCACLYRRGESNGENNELLLETIQHIYNMNYTHVLIMGDLNFRDIDWESSTTVRNNTADISFQFIECLRDCYLFQHVQEPTRQRGTDNPSTLDVLLTNEENMIADLEVAAPLGKSDHSVLKFKFQCYMEKEPPILKTMYHKGDYMALNKKLKEVNWTKAFSDSRDDVNKQWAIFKQIYSEAETLYIPKKLVYLNGKLSKKFTVPLDKKNLRKLKRKNKLWGKVRKELASAEEKLQYNKLRNQIRRLTRKGKKLLEKKIASECKTNPKSFWKYAQHKLKTRSSIPDIIKPGTHEPDFTKDDNEKAEVFLNYFSSVFTNEPDTEDMPYFGTRSYATELRNIEITEETVLGKLRKLKTNKSPGPDGMHPRVLHEISSSITVPITIIFKTSLRNMELPMEWKQANISAIHKKGKKILPENYRPVSLTSIICKTMESIIRDHIIKHMKDNNLFSQKQFGFIDGRSTTLQLLHVLHIWSDILDQGGSLDAVYCDFMKAFDKVPHKRLAHKVEKYGITGNIIGWIKSFLSERTQRVIIKSAESNPAPVTSGIPQGSVLGPILFVLYINDMPEVIDKDSFLYLFADDTKVFRQIQSEEDIVQLQADVNSLVNWSKTWLLRFHPDKCISMSFGTRQGNDNHIYEMENQHLAYSSCEKDLGVHIDDKLNFDKHINTIVNKANRILGIARKTFDHMDVNIFSSIFKGLVRPHLEYAAPVWSPHLVRQKELLENVQKRATKLVPGLSELSYPDRLRKLNLPTLAYRRVRGDMIQVYKMTCNTGGYDNTLPSILTAEAISIKI